MVLGLLCRVGSDGIITSTDNVDDGENYEDDVGTLAHWHTGTLAHSWLSLVMVSLLTRSLSNHSLLPTRHLRRSPEIKLHLI